MTTPITSPTPITNAARGLGVDWIHEPVVPINVAEKLEIKLTQAIKERDEALAKCGEISQVLEVDRKTVEAAANMMCSVRFALEEITNLNPLMRRKLDDDVMALVDEATTKAMMATATFEKVAEHGATTRNAYKCLSNPTPSDFTVLRKEDVEKVKEALKDYAGRCPNCGGVGMIVTTKSGHGCDGTEEDCARKCPIPIQEQEQCQWCDAALTTLALLTKANIP